MGSHPVLTREEFFGRASCNRSEYISASLVIGDAGDSGRALFVTRNVAPGELLLVEASSFERCSNDTADSFAQEWERHTPLQQWRLGALAPGHPNPNVAVPTPVSVNDWCIGDHSRKRLHCPSLEWFKAAARTNAMGVVEVIEKPDGLRGVEATADSSVVQSALYAIGCLINHSCLPSVLRMSFPGWLVVRSSRALSAGEEVTHPYIDVRRPVHIRRRDLKTEWGFICNCDRCELEHDIMKVGKQECVVADVWRRFESIAATGTCDEHDLVKLVSDAKTVVEVALECFLSKPENNTSKTRLRADISPAFVTTKKQRSALLAGRQLRTTIDTDVLRAFQRLYNLLLASIWISPAFEYANGLRFTGRVEHSLPLLKKINVASREVLPFSSLHATNQLTNLACSIEAGLKGAELIACVIETLTVLEVTYSDGFSSAYFLLEPWLRRLQPEVVSTILSIMRESHKKVRKVPQDMTNISGASSEDARQLRSDSDQRNANVGTDRAATPPDDIDVRIVDNRVVVKFSNVHNIASVDLEVASNQVKINGHIISLPTAIDVENAQSQWSKKHRALTFTAPRLEQSVAG